MYSHKHGARHQPEGDQADHKKYDHYRKYDAYANAYQGENDSDK